MLNRLKAEDERREQLVDQFEESNLEFQRSFATIINSLSQGKFVLSSEKDIEAHLGDPLTQRCELGGPDDLSRCRRDLEKFLSEKYPYIEAKKCIVAFGEAMTNAVKHADGGSFQLFKKDDVLQFMIEDTGMGIEGRTLPKAALTSGFSTVGTLGLGFTVMLEQCDKILLSSRPGKTILVLEVDI